MKKQKLITSSKLGGFDSQVNREMQSGWTVVPGTLTMATSCCEDSANFGHENNAFAVVLEREEP